MSAVADEFDPHALEIDDFIEQVRSFEFWFQAVEGYLTDRPYGHREDAPSLIWNRPIAIG
ncbi:MAG: hypothetical protein R2710_22935 [Acidimicrobiales bacterium]